MAKKTKTPDEEAAEDVSVYVGESTKWNDEMEKEISSWQEKKRNEFKNTAEYADLLEKADKERKQGFYWSEEYLCDYPGEPGIEAFKFAADRIVDNVLAEMRSNFTIIEPKWLKKPTIGIINSPTIEQREKIVEKVAKDALDMAEECASEAAYWEKERTRPL